VNSAERNAWNRRFNESWVTLQRGDLDRGRKAVLLDTEIAKAARMMRDRGQEAVPTAAGLYMGTQDARARLS
jgi:hypothetical protein